MCFPIIVNGNAANTQLTRPSLTLLPGILIRQYASTHPMACNFVRRGSPNFSPTFFPSPYVCHLKELQGCTKRWALGCVKLGGKVVFCLPSADRRKQIFHLIFTQPGAHLLVHVENVTTVITPPLVRYSRCAACESVSLTRRHRLLKGEQGSLIIFHSTSTVHTAPLSNLA